MILEALEGAGFRYCDKTTVKYRQADRLYQKRIRSDDLDIDFYLNAWVYDPSDYSPDRTVEFELQLDYDEANSADHCTKVKFFSFKSLSEREIERVERRAKNLYVYLKYA